MEDPQKSPSPQPAPHPQVIDIGDVRHLLPTPNYTLSSVCPACGNPTFKLACKVRCGKCGFMWDCSEL